MKQNAQANIELSKLLAHLSGTDALAILSRLAEDDMVAPRLHQVATAYLESNSPSGEEDIDEIAAEVYEVLEQLEVEEVWDRAGARRDGYVEPYEVADQMLGEAIEPYQTDITRYQELGLAVEATYVCLGLLAGLYQFEQESESQFKDWATDLPYEYAQLTLEQWRQGRPAPEMIQEARTFIREQLPNWQASLLRMA